jgi:hypothetical protein
MFGSHSTIASMELQCFNGFPSRKRVLTDFKGESLEEGAVISLNWFSEINRDPKLFLINIKNL